MKKRFLPITFFIIVIFYTNSCIAISASQKQEYGALMSAVTWSASAVIGEYGHAIPEDFNREQFLEVVQDKIPPRSYSILGSYPIKVVPKKGYYLLLVYDPQDNSLILFDYSCTTADVDGPVLLEPEKYDLNNLQLYDKCNRQN
jgi:hypothetical protein